MTTFTEGRHTAEFIISEANHQRSRENGIVKVGQNLVAGEIVQADGTGDLITADGVLDSAGDVVTPVAGILIDNVDASATGSNADTPAAYIIGEAEVNGNLLTYPDESTAGGEKVATVASLAALQIRVR